MGWKRLCTPLVFAAALGVSVELSAADAQVTYTVNKQTYSIDSALTDTPGDAKKGKAVAINRKKGNCLACHTMPIPEQPFHGALAPPLAGIGARYSAGQIRLRVVDPRQVNPVTLMPAFYKTAGLHRVAKKFQGKPILTAQEVEDVVAYLVTLK
ncbi:MAG: sulfur oxidation c-type cytochrome SoxX [Gammaproteobacteria bacterium]|nr:sulfur oxidation c-type cytochrome SoxX [Gammaproteobacteria bacterium]